MAERGLWIGTHPDGGRAGGGEGIWHVRLDERSGALSDAWLVVATPAPSFLARHPDGHTLYAVAEVAQGRVAAFATGPDGALAPRGADRSSGGAQPCHIVATPGAVLIANYGDGAVACVPLGADGALAGDVQSHRHAGSGPDPERQAGPHAHFVATVGDHVRVADLGTDELRRYRPVGSRLEPAGVAAVLPAGAGPRHFAVLPDTVAPDTVVVAGELDAGVHVVSGGRAVARYDATATPAPSGGRNYPSHIAASPDGTRVYVAVRGADVLATFAVEAGPAAPRLVRLHDTPVGRWPRHFAVVPRADGDLVIVANQESSQLWALRIDGGTGRGERIARLGLPRPACVLPS